MRPLGLSKSGKYFGHCVSPCDPCGLECTLVDLTTHQRVQLRTAGEHRGDPDYQPNAAEKRATELIAREYPDGEKSPQRHFAGVFPYEDIVFATKTEPMDANGKIALLFGARVAGEDAVFPYRMTMGPHGMWQNVQARASAANMREPELAALDVLGDGKEVGVVAFARGDSWFEAADMVIVPTAVLAGRLYNESGLVAHKAKRYAPAAALFAKASSAQPSESLFAYNEACARAKAGDAQAEAALQRAIKLGGNAIKARAKKDADFDDVKSAPWFGALTR